MMWAMPSSALPRDWAIRSFGNTSGTGWVASYMKIRKWLHFGEPGRGVTLEPGMVITIEPILNAGSRHCLTRKDGWTVVTRDRKWSAQFEQTVAITEDGPEVLTVTEDGSDIPDIVRDVTIDTEIR